MGERAREGKRAPFPVPKLKEMRGRRIRRDDDRVVEG